MIEAPIALFGLAAIGDFQERAVQIRRRPIENKWTGRHIFGRRTGPCNDCRGTGRRRSAPCAGLLNWGLLLRRPPRALARGETAIVAARVAPGEGRSCGRKPESLNRPMQPSARRHGQAAKLWPYRWISPRSRSFGSIWRSRLDDPNNGGFRRRRMARISEGSSTVSSSAHSIGRAELSGCDHWARSHSSYRDRQLLWICFSQYQPEQSARALRLRRRPL